MCFSALPRRLPAASFQMVREYHISIAPAEKRIIGSEKAEGIKESNRPAERRLLVL